MRWWILFLQMCNRKMPRPDMDEKAPVWVIPIWSDAAGAHWYPMGMVQDVLYFHPSIYMDLCSLGEKDQFWKIL